MNDEKELTSLGEVPNPDNKLKEYIINYTGSKTQPSDENVTIEMVLDVFAEEFPEFLLAIAEENWIRGYEQGLVDVEYGEKLANQQANEKLHKK